MAPTESHHTMIPVMGTQVPLTGNIPLSTLIDYIIQRTYHDLTVLSELLPRKTDMERKIEIVQFASRTCQLFVRLLALVKWANSASKVDKCAMISNFLDQQAKLFEKTADSLAVMARETLTHARLPSFSLPCAVDVLTTGSYPRLPTCIKEKIVPPDPIMPREKWQTLKRLNQIIEHRLVTSDLPKHMRRPQIQNGRVSFQVEHEFEVTLTLMGDGANIPWRLLLIEILVEDPETGDGKSLVHSLQVNYLHRLIQMRIMDSKKPLHDLYNCLHSFCQSLQLEVLHSQTQQLMRQRLGDHIHIEEYKAGEHLVISYWRDLMRKENKSYASTTFKLSVHMDTNDPSRPLQITHFPLIHGTESLKVAQAIKSDYLSIERLLVHTIHVRSLTKLKELQRELRLILSGQFKISDLPLVLYIPVITPCMDSEKICVSVHMQKGTFLISICRTETSLTADIEDSLNGDRRELRKLLSKLRLSLVLSRCAKSIQHLQVTTYHHLPLINLSGHPLEKLGKHKIFVKLAKQSDYYMVVEAYESDWMSVGFNHYLMHVQSAGFEGGVLEGEATEDSPSVYLKAGHLMQLDTCLCTHGPCSQLQELEEEEPDALSRKRKMFMKDQYGRQMKKQKCSPYFVPELCHILALCEDRIPFVALADELLKQGIAHQGFQVDGDGAALCLTLVDVLSCPSLKDNEAVRLMRSDLLSCKFRKGVRVWKVESVVANCPLQSTNSKEQGVIQRVYFEYELQGSETMERIVESLQEDWLAVCHLYQAVSDFAHIYTENPTLQTGIEVKAFTYKRLTLAYGPNKCYTVSIQYRPTSKWFRLAYGTCCTSNVANCHSMVAVQLENLLNDTHSIALLAQILVDTWSPLTSIGKLNTSPVMGLSKIVSQPLASFSIVPQSPVHIRLIFRNLYCIDIHCHRGNEVTLRDGAYSMFDTSKVVEGLNPTQGLKAFLNMYVDETMSSSQTRHQSTTEDDNPPSPFGMDTLDSLLSQPLSNSPSTARSKQDGGLRFQNPMTPPSNPHTPASPSTQRHGQTHSSPAAASFPLASPPSMTHGIAPSPSNIMAPSPNNPTLHVPSPSAFVPAPSPQSLGIHMPSPVTQFISPQGMLEGVGSPFASGSATLAMPSPGVRNWPASPSMPGPSPVSRPGGMLSPAHTAMHSPQTQLKDDYQKGSLSMLPSRMLPQRSWAGSIPTVLSHDALNRLLSPSYPPISGSTITVIRCCPLERFLCCMYLRRYLQRTIQSEDSLQMMQCNEPGVLMFKTDQLQFRISLNPNTLQSLHLTVTPTPEYQNHWELDELQVLERFFEFKVVSPPYKINTLVTFSSRVLSTPPNILKDFIKIMKMELLPDRNLKWSIQWCLTVPIGMSYPVGASAITVNNTKILFMVQLTRIGVAVPPGVESQNIVIPILYDHTMNTTQMLEQRPSEPTQANLAVSNMLKRFAEFNPNPNGCSIFPAMRELLTNLVVPMPGMNQPQ